MLSSFASLTASSSLRLPDENPQSQSNNNNDSDDSKLSSSDRDGDNHRFDDMDGKQEEKNNETITNVCCEVCEASTIKKDLFYCDQCIKDPNQTVQILCIGCGTIRHENKNHKFNVQNCQKWQKLYPDGDRETWKKKFRSLIEEYITSEPDTAQRKFAIAKIKEAFTIRKQGKIILSGLQASVITSLDSLTVAHSVVEQTVSCVNRNTFYNSKVSLAKLGCHHMVPISLLFYPLIFCIEWCFLGIIWKIGRITTQEFVFRLAKSVLRTGAAVVAATLIAATLVPTLGVAIGTIGSIAFGIAGAIIGGSILR